MPQFYTAHFLRTSLTLVVGLLSKCVLAQQPVITSFSPTFGLVGTVVTVKGAHFNTTPAGNIIFFGSVRADAITATDTSLTVAVPKGASYQPLSVSVNGLTAYAPQPFDVTFTGGSNAFVTTSFVKLTAQPTGAYPCSIAIGDFDGDGRPDIAVAGFYANTVTIFKNTITSGRTTFVQVAEYDNGILPSCIISGDLDGDGKPELAVANIDSHNISVYHNKSTSAGIAFDKVDYSLDGNSGPRYVAAGDIDSDGRPDLGVPNNNLGFPPSVTVIKNTSTGSDLVFSDRTALQAEAYTRGICMADLNGDGKQDIVVTNNTSASMSVFKNTSTGSSITFADKVDYSTGSYPENVVAGDFNGDGKPDLAVSNVGSGGISVFTNTGNGSDIAFTPSASLPGADVAGITVADFNGDGKPDLAATNAVTNTVSLFKNISTGGNISFATPGNYTTGAFPVNVASADVDLDGRPDLVVANGNDNTFNVFLNRIGVPFPLNLLSFKGTLANGRTELFWQTTFEDNTDYISVEYSGDATSFTALGTIAAAGSSNSVRQYNFTHAKPALAANYYRLKMVDKDGRYTYSPTILVNNAGTADGVQVYPNPATQQVTITYPAGAVTGQVTLFNMAGQPVKTVSPQPGQSSITINVTGLARGQYNLVWANGKTVKSRALTIQ